jgi:hypothetical protein
MNTDLLKKIFSKQQTGLVVSINDLRDREFSGQKLSSEERLALANYDRYRIEILNAQTDEEQFHYHYRQLQVVANLGDWKEFLKDEFQ